MNEIELPTGYGQVAYDAYRLHCGGRSARGELLPAWEDQRPDIRAHWDAAADAVRLYLGRIPS